MSTVGITRPDGRAVVVDSPAVGEGVAVRTLRGSGCRWNATNGGRIRRRANLLGRRPQCWMQARNHGRETIGTPSLYFGEASLRDLPGRFPSVALLTPLSAPVVECLTF